MNVSNNERDWDIGQFGCQSYKSQGYKSLA